MIAFWTIFIVVMVVSMIASLWLIADYLVGEDDWKIFWLPNRIAREWCCEHGIERICQYIIIIMLNIIMLPTMLLTILWLSIFWVIVIIIMLLAWVFRKR